MSEAKEKKEVTVTDLRKQLANVAYTVRKIKDWLEEKMGADIDGDGRIGSRPYRDAKKLGVFLLAMGLAAICQAAPWNTNIAVWIASTSYIDSVGGMHGATFHGSAAGLTAIPAGSIANSSISNVHLASNAVSSMKIDDGTVSNVDLAADSVTTGKILDGTIATADLATNAVTSTVINDGSVSNVDLASDISAAKLSAGTVATAIDGNAITNLDATDLLTGTVPNARLDADLQPLAEDDGGGLTNIVSGGIVSLSAAKLQAGTVATAIDGSAITNLAGANIASGDIASARMTVNAVVVSDFAAANDVLVGTGAGTFTIVTGSAARTVTNASTLSTNLMYFGSGGVLLSNVYNGP